MEKIRLKEIDGSFSENFFSKVKYSDLEHIVETNCNYKVDIEISEDNINYNSQFINIDLIISFEGVLLYTKKKNPSIIYNSVNKFKKSEVIKIANCDNQLYGKLTKDIVKVKVRVLDIIGRVLEANLVNLSGIYFIEVDILLNKGFVYDRK